jgi:hypothetical protein
MTDKMVMVPVEELQKLEEARVALYEILEKRKTLNSTEFLVSLSPVTSHMWKLSNTRWPEIEAAPQQAKPEPHYVHIHGPDDIHEFDSAEKAHEFANDVNESAVLIREGKSTERLALYPFVVATVHKGKCIHNSQPPEKPE